MISDVVLLCTLAAELTQSYTHGTCVRGYTHLRHPVARLKIFHGNREEGKIVAAAEVDQSQVKAITAWRGDPLVRTTMEFRVEFADGDVVWLPYSTDLDRTQAYGDYVASLPVLSHLQFSAQVAREYLSKIRSGPIYGYAPGDKVYVGIRCYSTEWYMITFSLSCLIAMTNFTLSSMRSLTCKLASLKLTARSMMSAGKLRLDPASSAATGAMLSDATVCLRTAWWWSLRNYASDIRN